MVYYAKGPVESNDSIFLQFYLHYRPLLVRSIEDGALILLSKLYFSKIKHRTGISVIREVVGPNTAKIFTSKT